MSFVNHYHHQQGEVDPTEVYKSLQRIRERKLANFIPWFFHFFLLFSFFPSYYYLGAQLHYKLPCQKDRRLLRVSTELVGQC